MDATIASHRMNPNKIARFLNVQGKSAGGSIHVI